MKRLCLAGGVFLLVIISAMCIVPRQNIQANHGGAAGQDSADCNPHDRPTASPDYSIGGNYNSAYDWYKFPFGFLCPRDAGQYMGVKNTVVDGSRQGGGSTSTAKQVHGGFEVSMDVGFDNIGSARSSWNDGSNRHVYIWSVIDGSTGNVSYSAPRSDGTEYTLGGTSAADDSSFHGKRTCPPNTDPVQPYQGVGNDADTSTPGYQRSATKWGDPLNDPDRSPLAGSPIGCETEGDILAWHIPNVEAGADILKRFKVKFNQFTGDNIDHAVCVRTYISVSYNAAHTFPNGYVAKDALKHVAGRSLNTECWKITRSFTQGHFRSSQDGDDGTSRTGTFGTGRLLDPSAGKMKISYGTCDLGQALDADSVVNNFGYFSFGRLTKGGYYCMHPQDTITVPDADGSTTYRLRGMYVNTNVNGPNTEWFDIQNGSVPWHDQVAGLKCSGAAGNPSGSSNWITQCGQGSAASKDFFANTSSHLQDSSIEYDFTFVYDPVPTPPQIEKDSEGFGTLIDPGTGNPVQQGYVDGSLCCSETLRPGDQVRFSVTIKNNRDINQFVTVKDYIPLNVDPDIGNIVLNCVQIDMTDDQPPPWEVEDSSVSCNSSALPGIGYGYNYGNDDGDLTTSIASPTAGRYIYSHSAGRTITATDDGRPYVGFRLERMPAYSELTFEWDGIVKQADDVGVYPGYNADNLGNGNGDYRYCSNPVAGGSFADQNWIMSNCQDKSVNGGFQGVINYIHSWADGNVTPSASRITYNPIPGDLKSVCKSINMENDVNSDSDIFADPCASAPTFTSPLNEYDPTDQELDQATIAVNVSPDGDLGPIEYRVFDNSNFSNDFNAQNIASNMSPASNCYGPVAANTCNTTAIWGTDAAPIRSTNNSVNTFGFDVTFSGNAVPGTPLTNTAKVCWKKYWELGHGPSCRNGSAQVERGDSNNPYFGALRGGLHAGGKISAGSNSCVVTGNTVGNIEHNGPSYGQYVVSATGTLVTSRVGLQNISSKCRPDLGKHVKAYRDRGASFRSSGPSTYSGSMDSGYYAKVVEPSSGDVLINGQLDVSRRWTLHVRGDLYIRGDIKNLAGSAASISNQPSLGIFVEGNVYISKDVSQIDALIYAKPTSGGSGGTINTCSNGANQSLGQTYTVADCRFKDLTVNGFLMGKTIYFTRTRENTGAGNQESEIIKLVGRAYALPPPGFTSLVSGPETTVIEKRPRF